MKRIVVALGGNAILPKGASGTAGQQKEQARKSIEKLASVIKNNSVVITHGNGPQVGALFLQQTEKKEIPGMPLYVLDAMTQGQIGHFISNAMVSENIPCATVITHVVVDEKDPAFENPTKPIGPFFERPVMEGMKEDAGRGYRLFVASPKPLEILESSSINALLEKNMVVIAAGGGGIPVNKKGNGLKAVIDKDRASALLASSIGAETLIIVTSIDSVYTGFGTPEQKRIGEMNVKKAKDYLESGEFAEGSMKPKVEAAVNFLKKGGKRVLICSIDDIEDAIKKKKGTEIIR